MMLVVVLLLLPVFLTGASLEVPGAGCGTHNCCVLASCHGHHGCCDATDEAQLHGCHHHHHTHERIYLLSDAGLRSDSMNAVVSAACAPCGLIRMWPRAFEKTVLAYHTGAPPYRGHMAPLRC